MPPETAAQSPLVSVTDLRKVYEHGTQITALDGISFELDTGSHTAVMGPSGSGKSTLLNLLGCLDTPSAGSIQIDGAELTELSESNRTAVRATTVGFVFQTFNLVPTLSARENVALPLVFQDVSRRERRARATELLRRVGLADRQNHRPSELSGGQRQRVAIARALVADPALVLADEPTGNLDMETGEEIMGLLEELNDAGNTILVVTHERHVAAHAEKIIHLLDGRVERTERVPSRERARHNGEERPADGELADQRDTGLITNRSSEESSGDSRGPSE